MRTFLILNLSLFVTGYVVAQTASTTIALSVNNPLYPSSTNNYRGKSVTYYAVSNLATIQLRATVNGAESLDGIVVNPPRKPKDKPSNVLYLKTEKLELFDDGDIPWDELGCFDVISSSLSTSISTQLIDVTSEFPFSKPVIDALTYDFLLKAAKDNPDKKLNQKLISHIGDSVKAMENLYVQNRRGLYSIKAVLQTTDSSGTVTTTTSDPILVRVEFKGNFYDKLTNPSQ